MVDTISAAGVLTISAGAVLKTGIDVTIPVDGTSLNTGINVSIPVDVASAYAES